MDTVKLFKQKLGDKVSKKLLSSSKSYQLAEFLLINQGNFPYSALKELTSLGLQQTERAYRGADPVVFTTAFFPEEVVHALGAVPFAPEVAAATSTSLNLSDDFLKTAEKHGFSNESCTFHRVAGAGALEDCFPQADIYLASSHLCDGAPQLFRFLAQRNDKPVYLLDVPINKSEAAVGYLSNQIEELINELGRRLQVYNLEDRLQKTLELSNQARDAQQHLNNVRKSYPGALSGQHSVNLVYLHFLCQGLEKTPSIFEQLADEIEANNCEGSDNGRPKILWSHLRPFYQNDLFNILEEELEVNVAFEEMNYVYWPKLDPGKPYESLARKMLNNPYIGPIENRMSALEDMVKTYNADGVIHFSHWGCRQAVGGVPYLRKSLKERGVSFLNLESDCVDQRNYFSGQIRTRLESFAEMMES